MDASQKKDNAPSENANGIGNQTSGNHASGAAMFANGVELALAANDTEQLKSNMELLMATAEAEVASLGRMIDMLESNLEQAKKSC